MGNLSFRNVKIVGMSACLPKAVEESMSLPVFKDIEEAQRVIESTGIERKRVVKNGTTASDMAFQSAEELLGDLGWDRDSIDCLIYVGISRDYIAPITSAIMQGRLGLREDCYCVDLPLGCSGWVFGLSVIGSLLSHGCMKRGLLINAETNSLNRNKRDKTVRPLFGDAATVTALEFDAGWASPMEFDFGADGKNHRAVITDFGGSRNPTTPECLVDKEVEPGIWRKGTDMVVNGMDVFSFGITTAPKSVKKLAEHFGFNYLDADYFIFHQANMKMNNQIVKKLKVDPEKVPSCMYKFGNTSSASIPLTIVSQLKGKFENKLTKFICCGFGVGLSWGTVALETQNVIIPSIVEVKDDEDNYGYKL